MATAFILSIILIFILLLATIFLEESEGNEWDY